MKGNFTLRFPGSASAGMATCVELLSSFGYELTTSDAEPNCAVVWDEAGMMVVDRDQVGSLLDSGKATSVQLWRADGDLFLSAEVQASDCLISVALDGHEVAEGIRLASAALEYAVRNLGETAISCELFKFWVV